MAENKPNRTAPNSRWIGAFFNELAQEFNTTGRTEDATRIYEAFRILNNFFSAVHVPVNFYAATDKEDDSAEKTVAVMTGQYKQVNDNTVQVTCVPGAMITWEVAKHSVSRKQKPHNINENKSEPGAAASASTE